MLTIQIEILKILRIFCQKISEFENFGPPSMKEFSDLNATSSYYILNSVCK